jgi:hypothetical protein
MKSLFVAAAISLGVVASTAVPATANQTSGWALDISGNDTSFGDLTFINEDGNQIEWPMAAAQGFPGLGISGEDVKDPGDSGEGEDPEGGGSLPAVPLPAPLLMAACGLVAVVIGRNQLSKIVGR